ncbi:aminopeptidase PepB [Psychromonas sp. Urea-02u-13]|uniref:aminopeptidase PepB n=1 Tax=Psychromonas sp. Urea-02u-13 TaxID=2058326 RepID=UPI000C33718A|nr:aminopeptidase PepB [Psychromonas sp. Urea-02u-13]PKG39981.1 aminopeptidase PepB [Psychromonas sp. Urea-02u-13]
MSNFFCVSLSFEPASSVWGNNALLSFSEAQAVIHLDDSKSLVRQVQSAARKLDSMSLESIKLQGEHWDCELRWAFSQGLFNAKKGANVHFGEIDEAQLQTLTSRKLIVEWVRNTINLGPEALSPEMLCTKAVDLIKHVLADNKHLNYQIISGEQLQEQGFHGTYQVGKGSERPPAMLQLDYNPTGDENAPVEFALVGKGITFDSGGYSLKPSGGMAIMKSDMGGAATLTGALALAIVNGLQKRVTLYLCCAENLVSGSAFKLGDVITYKNGVTAEVLNSDAEGRLVLADGLLAAQEDNPKRIIDAATLTGSAKMAVGRDYNCLLTMDDEFAQFASECAKTHNEMLWRLPFEDFHMQQISSSFADIANIHSGEGMAGASTATAFLAKFVKTPEKDWLHFDLSGSYQMGGNALWATGGKGHGVLMISQILSA